MFGDLLKALELLINAIRGTQSPDHKREALARELFKLQKQIEAVVDRGRAVLGMEPAHEMSKNNPAVRLLSEQIGALREISDTLTSGVIADVLQLHLPRIYKGLFADLDSKGRRVWLRLDSLVSENAISPQKWVDNMEAQMASPDEGQDIGSTNWPHPLTICDFIPGDGPLEPSEARAVMNDYDVGITASNEDLQKGYRLLDQISAANSELRKFLIEKFKFEDIL
jgi:hypothetical protein